MPRFIQDGAADDRSRRKVVCLSRLTNIFVWMGTIITSSLRNDPRGTWAERGCLPGCCSKAKAGTSVALFLKASFCSIKCALFECMYWKGNGGLSFVACLFLIYLNYTTNLIPKLRSQMVRVIHFWFTRISYVVCIKNLFSDTLAMGKELEALQNAKN